MDDGTRDEPTADFVVEVGDMAGSGQATQPPGRESGLSPRRRMWRLVSAVGIVALVAAVVLLDVSGRLNPRLYLSKQPPPPPPLTLQPQTQGMTCLTDAAWAPRGTRVALLSRLPLKY